MAQVAIIVNPVKVDDPQALEEAVTQRTVERGWPPPMVLETSEADPGTGIARQAVDDGADIVLAAGGDGTVAAVVSGLVGTGAALAVLPSGTGNLLARNLGLPMDLDSVLDAVLDGRDRAIDVGEVLEGPSVGSSFAVMAGIGLDAAMVEDAPDSLKAAVGWPAYIVSAVQHLGDEPFDCWIEVDGGEPLQRSARSVLVANVGSLQGGIDLAPDADAADGVLDVIVLGPQTAVDWLRLGARLVIGSDREDQRIERFRGRHVRVTSDTDESCQLDGDVIGTTRVFVAEVRPRALTLRVPLD
jgi:YegS/Rv2252/BmrU family lipid kinase